MSFWPYPYVLEQGCPSSFFNRADNFNWTHVEYPRVDEKEVEGE
jgi:hypothetical protein